MSCNTNLNLNIQKMNIIFSCIPQGWVFQDPKTSVSDKNQLLQMFLDRAKYLVDKSPFPQPDEMTPGRLLWYLNKTHFNLESSYQLWLDWVKWKRSVKFDGVTSEMLQQEIDANVGFWNGTDKSNRVCCVVTARNHDTCNRKGNFKSFRRFMLHLVEEGCALADEALYKQHLKEVAVAVYKQPIVTDASSPSMPTIHSQEKICLRSNNSNQKLTGLLDTSDANTTSMSASTVKKTSPNSSFNVAKESDQELESDSACDNTAIATTAECNADGSEAHGMISTVGCDGKICILYDRRGIGDANIDPVLFQLCRQLFNDIQDYYGDRLGMLYVLHANWMYLLLFQYILNPFLQAFGKNIVTVYNEESELLKSFDSGEIHLLSYNDEANDTNEYNENTADTSGSVPVTSPNSRAMFEELEASRSENHKLHIG